MDDRIWISIDTETSEGQGERRWTEGFSTTWISLADCHKFLPLCSLFQCTSRRVLVLKSSARGLVTVRSCRRRDGYARKRFGRRNFLYQRRHFSTTCHVLKPSCPFPGQTEPYGTSYRLPIPLIDDAPLLFDDEHPVLGEPHRDRSRQVHPPPPLVGGRPDLSRHLARSARFVQAPFVDEVDHRSLDEGHVGPSVRRCLALPLPLLAPPGRGGGGRPPSSCSVLCPIRHCFQRLFSAIDETLGVGGLESKVGRWHGRPPQSKPSSSRQTEPNSADITADIRQG